MGIWAYYTRATPEMLDRARTDRGFLRELREGKLPGTEQMTLEKTWEGIAWLVSDFMKKEKNLDFPSSKLLEIPVDPLLEVIRGIEEIEDQGCLVSAEVVRKAWLQLEPLKEDDLLRAFDADIMDRHGVYPETLWAIEGQAAFEEYLLPYYRDFRQFLNRAAQEGQGIFVRFG